MIPKNLENRSLQVKLLSAYANPLYLGLRRAATSAECILRLKAFRISSRAPLDKVRSVYSQRKLGEERYESGNVRSYYLIGVKH